MAFYPQDLSHAVLQVIEANASRDVVTGRNQKYSNWLTYVSGDTTPGSPARTWLDASLIGKNKL